MLERDLGLNGKIVIFSYQLLKGIDQQLKLFL
jgi:hypothetical protein